MKTKTSSPAFPANTYIAAALQTLPNPESSTEEVMYPEIKVPGIGRVRVTAKRSTHKHGKARMYSWRPQKVVAVEAGSE